MKTNSKYKSQLKYQRTKKITYLSFEAWKILNTYKIENNLSSMSEAIVKMYKELNNA